MIKTMTRDAEKTGGFWIVTYDKEREKDDTYNHFHLAWTDYDTEPLNVIRFVEQHEPLHSASESEISEVESTDVESLGSNPEGPIGGQGPTSGGGKRRKKKTRKKKGGKIPLDPVEGIKDVEIKDPATRDAHEVGEVEPEVIIDIRRVINESDLETGSDDSSDEEITGGSRRKKKTRKKKYKKIRTKKKSRRRKKR